MRRPAPWFIARTVLAVAAVASICVVLLNARAGSGIGAGRGDGGLLSVLGSVGQPRLEDSPASAYYEDDSSYIDAGSQFRPGATFFHQRGIDHVLRIMVASDRRNVAGMVTVVHSVVTNTRWNHSALVFHLVVEDEPMQSHVHAWIRHYHPNVTLDFRVFNASWVAARAPVLGHRKELGSPLNFARYFIPDLYPDVTGRLVFLDDDVVVQGDIAELYHVQMDPAHFIAFSTECSHGERVSAYRDYLNFSHPAIAKKHMDPDACPFNAGVFVAHMRKWRVNHITQRLVGWLQRNSRDPYIYGTGESGGASQPPLLIVFYGLFTPIADPLWHVKHLGWTASKAYSAEYLKSAKLLHWNGMWKPWLRIGRHLNRWMPWYVEDPTGQYHPERKLVGGRVVELPLS